MKLQDACNLLEDFFRLTDGMFERIEVAGSVRRQRLVPRDIDLVAVPLLVPVSDLFGDPTDEMAFPFGLWVTANADVEVPEDSKALKRGADVPSTRKIVPFYFACEKVEVYLGTPENFAILWLIRTGPAEQNRRLAMRARRMGKRLSYNQGLVDVRTGKVQTFQTEEEVYAALSLPMCFAENRDHPDWHKLIQSNRTASGIWVPGGDGLEEEVGQVAQAERERMAKRAAMTPEERRAQRDKDMADLGFLS